MCSRIRSIAVLGLCGLLVACGSSGTAGKTTTAPTKTTIPSTAELQTRLLAVNELGAGWKVGEPINSEDLASVAQTIPCDKSLTDQTVVTRLTAVTGIQFEPIDRSYKHVMELILTGEPQRLDADLQVLFKAIESCATAAPQTPGAGALTVTRLDIPELGDQRAAFVLIGAESPTAVWYVRNAAVRVGSVAVAFGLTEILASKQAKPQISDATFVQLVKTAVAKLSV